MAPDPLEEPAMFTIAALPATAFNETDEMSEDDRMNHERSKLGHYKQVSGESNTSGVSTTHSLEELSSPEFFSHQCSEIDAMTSRVVDESRVMDAIRAVVDDVAFCITIADPRSQDYPLIAVSEKFEAITGYSRAEVLGKNCRFLNTGCSIALSELVQLRAACQTGASFTTVLQNRRKTGDLFLNLLDLRGLTVARNPCTGEELWFLVGVQADVTNVGHAGLAKHLEHMHEVADSIRKALAGELSAMAIAGALTSSYGRAKFDQDTLSPDAFCLLNEATWRRSGNEDVHAQFLSKAKLPLSSFNQFDLSNNECDPPMYTSVAAMKALEEIFQTEKKKLCEHSSVSKSPWEIAVTTGSPVVLRPMPCNMQWHMHLALTGCIVLAGIAGMATRRLTRKA